MDMSDNARMAGGLRGTLRRDEPMAKHVSWRAGGRARLFYQPADVADLCEFLRGLDAGVPTLFVGRTSRATSRAMGERAPSGWRGSRAPWAARWR